MTHGTCGVCHWFNAADPAQLQAGGACLESPPRVMLLPVAAPNAGKVLAPNQQPQHGFALQSVYPMVMQAARCSRFKARAGDTH